MELRQIRYFIEVAKREHMTEAAEVLHVAQSAISRQITNLEAELGVDLFIREGRQVKLTQMGRVFLEHAEVILNQVEQAKKEIAESLHPERGRIQIGFPSSLAIHTLPHVISSFREHHPHIQFELRQGSYDELIQMVISGETGLAFIAPVPNHHSKVSSTILFTERMQVLLPANHPMASQTYLRLQDLQNEPFILFPKGYKLHEFTIQACKHMGFTPNVAFEGESIDTIKGLVIAGLGICLLPEVTLANQIPDGAVKISLREPELNRSVGLIHSKLRKLPPAEQRFFTFTQQFFSLLDPFRS